MEERSVVNRPQRAGSGKGSAHRRGPGETVEGAIRSRLEQELGREWFERYFDARTTLAYRDGDVEITAPSSFLAERLDRRFGEPIRRVAQVVVGEEAGAEVKVRFRVERVPGDPPEERVTLETTSVDGGRKPARPRRGPGAPGSVGDGSPASSRPGRGRRATLAEYVVGAGNRLAFETACRIADPSEQPEFARLVIHGACGMGKTHLLWGIVDGFKSRSAGARALYTTAESFTNAFVEAVRANRVDAFRAKYRRLDLLCIDDVHFLPKRRGTQDELLHTLDALETASGRLVMASDAHPRRVGHLSAGLVSRCVSGLVVELPPPDPELSHRLVVALAKRHGLRLDDECAAVIANAARRAQARPSVRDLEGLVTRVAAYAGLVEQTVSSIDAGVVRRAIGLPEASGVRRGRPLTIEEITETVCQRLAIQRADLLGKGRHKRVVLARELVAHLSRRLTSLSFPEIAAAFGRRSHSTFVQAEHRLRRMIDGEAELPDLGPGIASGSTAKSLVDELLDTLSRPRQ